MNEDTATHACEQCRTADDTVRLSADPVTGAHRWLCRSCHETRSADVTRW